MEIAAKATALAPDERCSSVAELRCAILEAVSEFSHLLSTEPSAAA
ncbi:MAG: hypothetical protein KDA24_29305 [Deltaproteobacteria bacterium]|nr:hypothetical protein [Deltaproteobacteria bacterium]